MAIDKNSKAYQNLLNSGYSDQQITDMYNKASSGQSRQEVVANTKPVNTSTTQPTTQTTAPVEQPTEQPTQTTPKMKQETEIKQQETVGSTVPEIKQEGELKPLSQDYYNQTGDDAQNKIRYNLNQYRQSNPGLFSTYEDFKKNFSYDARNDEQKQTLDSWYGEYQKGMEYGAMPTADLYTQYKDGSISTSDLEILKTYNPEKYTELQSQINRGNIIAAYDDTAPTEKQDFQDLAYQYASELFKRFMSGNGGSEASKFFDDYRANMDSPEMMELQDKQTDLIEQGKNIQDQIFSIQEDVEKEYEGTGATKSKINAIIADRTYDLQQQLRTINNEYEKYATQYNNRATQYQNEFQLQLQEYQVNMQARNQQMQELGFAMDLMNFETIEQKQQREWDYRVKQQEYTNGNINSKDYDTRYKAALKSVQNLLSQYEGIPMQRSAEQMAQDVLTAIDNGSDLGAELTKINKQIQGKPEYKYLYNQTYKPAATSSGTSLQSYKVGDTEYVVYNGEMMTAADFNSKYGGKAAGSTGAAKPYDIVNVSAFDMGDGYQTKAGTLGAFLSNPRNTKGNTGGWCGAFVNKYLKSIGVTNDNYYDDSIETKLNSVNSQVPKVGSIAVYDYGHITKETGKNHGHVGIVTKVYEDGSYDVIDSNFGRDKKIQVRTHLNPQSSNCKGFFDPSQPPAGSKTNETSIVSGSIEGVPLAYERAVKNLVPAALQNSDAEREALNTIITNSYKGGIDQSEIALKFMGFDIKNDEDKALATDLVNTIRTLSTDTQEGVVQTISDLMNQGKYTNAIQTVENAVSQQAKAAGNYVSELSVKNTINKSNDLYDTISNLKNSPTGVVSGTMESWLGKYASKDAKNIQSKISLLENSLDIKDKETAQRILPQLTDTPAVFMTKLENLGNNMMLELNGWRTIYGLPELTTDALTNYSKRVNLYRNGSTVSSGNTSYQVNSQTNGWYKDLTTEESQNQSTTVNVGGYDFPANW